jgi:hypothetical protein
MKKVKHLLLWLIACSFLFSSCATVLGGEITKCQKQKPEKGEAKRKMRAAPLIAGIITVPFIIGIVSLVVDFSTKAIYKPCNQPAGN